MYSYVMEMAIVIIQWNEEEIAELLYAVVESSFNLFKCDVNGYCGNTVE